MSKLIAKIPEQIIDTFLVQRFNLQGIPTYHTDVALHALRCLGASLRKDTIRLRLDNFDTREDWYGVLSNGEPSMKWGNEYIDEISLGFITHDGEYTEEANSMAYTIAYLTYKACMQLDKQKLNEENNA